MKYRWYLSNTNNINQMLRLRADINEVSKKFPNLVLLKHNFHIADDIMFPDASCLAFFNAFENNYLNTFEKNEELVLLAVDICEGLIQFFIYCNDVQKVVYDSISFLKSNNLYKCEFKIILNDKADRLNKLI
jgi:hypothetical protein